jgi:hypothetical protein
MNDNAKAVQRKRERADPDRGPLAVQEDILDALLEILEYQKDILACLQSPAVVKDIPLTDDDRIGSWQAHREER